MEARDLAATPLNPIGFLWGTHGYNYPTGMAKNLKSVMVIFVKLSCLTKSAVYSISFHEYFYRNLAR